MRFKVENIIDYSPRSKKVELSFVETNTSIDGFHINIFSPIKETFTVGEIQNIPKYLCDNIWNLWLKNTILSNIKKECTKKFHNRKIAKEQTEKMINDYLDCERLNVEEIVEPIGKFVGNIDDRIILDLNVVEYITTFYSKFGKYELWKFSDNMNNIFNIKTGSSDVIEIFSKYSKIRIIGRICNHSKYRNENQNFIKLISKHSVIPLN